MKIAGLKLIQFFRNYPQLELELDKNLNLFVGVNRQGKTNLLESIFFLVSRFSFLFGHTMKIKGETGEYPVLLFDDVFSELDESHRRFLVETIEGRVQTFITGTEAERLGNFKHSGRMFTVSHGEVL